ncbi:hypothetical protein PPL_04292 [Heterostelium album PN500]|uniref:Uncharacterized protein n=1 Tax=Heterostelium pallidum (strain ATCC 26659 / Pp 5 / PN500) TaxID=670386 RepID=D3B757_HETP5|nr:hypothetical protein PPL_04292 [Heterostelium album PN500]EFA82600.1 hypothetical protein PPL_04292 [Heterostelium album PN500]|eukprot:XP_020434717.1 hypothetical protein PPL_04292 [Heterostelium album PN500]
MSDSYKNIPIFRITSDHLSKKSKWGVRNKLRLVNQKGSSFPCGLVRYRGKKATDLVIESSGEVVTATTTTTTTTVALVTAATTALIELQQQHLLRVFTYISIGIVIATVNYYNFSVPYPSTAHSYYWLARTLSRCHT